MIFIKIALNLGHGCGKDVGARNEEFLINKIGPMIQGHLQNLGHQVILTRPSGNLTVNQSLKARTDKANSNNCDIFISLHCNAFDSKAHGSEIFSYDGKDKLGASKILKEFSEIGFTNRGVKNGSHLADLKNSKMTALLIEFCFGDNTEDKARMEANLDKMARIVVSNIVGTDIRVKAKKTCGFCLDNVHSDTSDNNINGVILSGWCEARRFTLFINGHNYGIRECSVSRPDVAKHLGRTDTDKFGYELGIVSDALSSGHNHVVLEWYDSKVEWKTDWIK